MIDREELALECVRRSAVDNDVHDRVNLIHASWNEAAGKELDTNLLQMTPLNVCVYSYPRLDRA